MNLQRAKELLAVLADGINPLTGEVLPDSDSCNQADIVRALHAVLMNLDSCSKKGRSLPENAGKPWTPEEDNMLIEAYRNGATSTDLAKTHNRSRGAITSRLSKLGEIKK
jgi:hypothetical protein